MVAGLPGRLGSGFGLGAGEGAVAGLVPLGGAVEPVVSCLMRSIAAAKVFGRFGSDGACVFVMTRGSLQ